MRIRSKLIASLCASTLVCIIAVVGLAWGVSAERNLIAMQERARITAHAATDLLVLAQEFVYRGEPRAAQQWRLRHAVIGQALTSTIDHPMTDTRAMKSMRDTHAQLAALFAALERHGDVMDGTLASRQKLMIADTLLTKIQSMSDDAAQWASRVSAERRIVSQHLVEFFAAVVAVFAIIAAQFSYLITRRVLSPLAALEDAVAAVQDGDFTRRTNSLARDEIGNLARQFDAMNVTLSTRDREILEATRLLEEEVLLRAATESRIRLITDNLPILVAYINQEGRYVFANRQYDFLLGLDSVAMVGKRVSDVLGPLNFKQVQPHVDMALAGQTAVFEVRFEAEYVQRDMYATYIPDFDPLGTVQGFFVMHEDVTVQKKAQAELHALNDRYVLAMGTEGVGTWGETPAIPPIRGDPGKK